MCNSALKIALATLFQLLLTKFMRTSVGYGFDAICINSVAARFLINAIDPNNEIIFLFCSPGNKPLLFQRLSHKNDHIFYFLRNLNTSPMPVP
jgi:hypothetical protein